MIEIIAFDADDTLWDNEILYLRAKESFLEILSAYQPIQLAEERLNQIEIGNVPAFGYGIESFTLSMVEAAIDISGGKVSAEEILKIIDLGREMQFSAVRLFPHTREILGKLSQQWPLMLITKGDMFEQSTKIERTGLVGYFRYIEVVGEKSRASYQTLFEKYSINPRKVVMVGNSLRSDILPIVELGGWAVYIPYANTWLHEQELDRPLHEDSFFEIEHLGQLDELIRRINQTP